MTSYISCDQIVSWVPTPMCSHILSYRYDETLGRSGETIHPGSQIITFLLQTAGEFYIQRHNAHLGTACTGQSF